MAAYRPSKDALPNDEAYEGFVKANFLADGSPLTVVLALHGTQEVNAVSICGLRPSKSSGTCGPGAYLAFGLDEIVNYMRGKNGVVIVCLIAHGGLSVFHCSRRIRANLMVAATAVAKEQYKSLLTGLQAVGQVKTET
jgi:hypothetical protein